MAKSNLYIGHIIIVINYDFKMCSFEHKNNYLLCDFELVMLTNIDLIIFNVNNFQCKQKQNLKYNASVHHCSNINN